MVQFVQGVASDGPSGLVGASARRRDRQNDTASRRQVDHTSIVSHHEPIRDKWQGACLLGGDAMVQDRRLGLFARHHAGRPAGARKYFG